jgi:hypothetical protein
MKREEIKINKHMILFPEYYEVRAIIDYSKKIPMFSDDIAETYTTKVDFQYLDDTITDLEDNGHEVDCIEYIVYDRTENHGKKGVVYNTFSYDEAVLYDDLLAALWYAKDASTELSDYDIH